MVMEVLQAYPSKKFGNVTAYRLRQGDKYPCPQRGYPPYVHERAEAAVVLVRGDSVVRVVMASGVTPLAKATFRGGEGAGRWKLDEDAIRSLAAWLAEPYKAPRKRTQAPPPPKLGKWPQELTKGVTELRRSARVHPFATRQELGDCDYRHKLNPEERAALDEFTRETVLNRWPTKTEMERGAQPIYPHRSSASREIQFRYNRAYDDIYSSKEWFPKDIDGPARAHPGRNAKTRSYSEVLANTSNPTEDELIDAIDRSRE